MYCKKCGNEIEMTDAFCASCGIKIEHKEKEIPKSKPSIKPLETHPEPVIQVPERNKSRSLDGYFDVEEVVTYEEEIDSTISRNLVFSIEKENEQEILDREYVGMNKEVAISNKTPLSNLNLDYDAFQPGKQVDKDPFIKKRAPRNPDLKSELKPEPKLEPVEESAFVAEKTPEIEKKQVIYDMLAKELDSLEDEVNTIAEKTPLEDDPTWKAFIEDDEVVEEKDVETKKIEEKNRIEEKQETDTKPVGLKREEENQEVEKQEAEHPEKIMDKLMIVLLSVVAILSLAVLIFFIFQDQIFSLFSTITLMVHMDSSILGGI